MNEYMLFRSLLALARCCSLHSMPKRHGVVTSLSQSFYTTVGSHLSELQLSEHISYPNAFSKAAPTISGYFRRVSGLALPVAWQLKTQDNFYGQGRLRNKGESNCQSHPLGTASLLHEMETEQRLWLCAF